MGTQSYNMDCQRLSRKQLVIIAALTSTLSVSRGYLNAVNCLSTWVLHVDHGPRSIQVQWRLGGKSLVEAVLQHLKIFPKPGLPNAHLSTGSNENTLEGIRNKSLTWNLAPWSIYEVRLREIVSASNNFLRSGLIEVPPRFHRIMNLSFPCGFVLASDSESHTRAKLPGRGSCHLTHSKHTSVEPLSHSRP